MPLLRRFRLPVILAIMSVITCLTTILTYNYISHYNSPKSKITDFNQTLNLRFEQSQTLINEIALKFPVPTFQELHYFSEELPQNMNLFVVKNGTLIFWSNNSIPFNYQYSSNRILQTPNGYFQQNRIEKNNHSYILLDLIKFEYPYQNDYLESSYNPIYKLTPDFEISVAKGDHAVLDKQNNELFYINTLSRQPISDEQEFVLFTLTLLTFILLIFSLYYTLINTGLRNSFTVLITVLLAVMSRVFLFILGIPNFLKEFDLFSPLNYASSPWLPSLGDLFTNVLIFTILGYLFYKCFKSIQYNPTKKGFKILIALLCVAGVNFLYYLSLYLLDTLIINSSFELNLSRILDFSIYSLLAYFIIAMILLSFFYITYVITRIAVKISGALAYFIIFSLLSTGLWFMLHSIGLYTPQWQELIIFIVYSILLISVINGVIPYPHVTGSTLLILVLTFVSTFCLFHNSVSKENEERKLMAIRLSSEQDKIAEYLYSELERSILSDTILYNYFMSAWYDPDEEHVCINYLLSRYFNGYWSKYNTQITLCYPGKELVLKPSDVIIGCNDYFNNIIQNITYKTSNKTLFYIKESYGVNNYIAKIPIYNSSFQKETASIVIEFTQKYVPKGLGYPELLLDKSFVSFYDLNIYSYAIYSNGELIKNVGDYSYSISEKPFYPYKSENHFFNKNGYNHLYYIVNNSTSIIISKKNSSLLDRIAPFTYQLIFHILLIFILTTAYYFRFSHKKYPDLKSQLQIMLVALVLFASLITGLTTLHNIKNLNEKKNKDMLSEKAHSVLIEIEHKLDTVKKIESSQESYLQELLTKFSLVFFSDINLYTTKGDLLATSRPEIFNEGLRSEYMSSEAFNQIAVNQRTFFVTNEQIGSYKYLSAYIPFRNKENELIAYINLPFFARENELRQEISSFLVTFVNVYIILTAIAVFISLLVGNYVTRPLQLIRDQFSNVKLDKRNEKITYTRNDELGNLINEYNLMLDKLSDSVNKLAQSERESAWKEMARQIAHEIKNPLTPMKLSIQHLYRSWQDKSPDWESRLEKTTTSIIQQIDSLAAIASAFSDFAKFPAPSNEKVELIKLIKDTVDLFTTQTDLNISIIHPDQPCYVYSDKKQLSRVMVNLINNAIQSIPIDRKGQINIRIETSGLEHHIYISDNGIGIPDDQKSRIFSPNFTTKSGGAGLGLAMVKNIIDSANGKISFSSSPDGTTFEIYLKALKNESNLH